MAFVHVTAQCCNARGLRITWP